jgi:hypothetical protein
MRGRMSSVFMLVVTSGPRLGDLEAGVVATLSSAARVVKQHLGNAGGTVSGTPGNA